MRFQDFRKIVPVATAAAALMTSGCATVFVRSPGAWAPEHVFPATVFDAQMFWEAGVKGEPLFAMADRDAKNSPFARVACSLGALIDAPFSIAFDTVLLPVDLFRAKRGVDERDLNGEKGTTERPEK
jgi:uncharacterized protein YceK